MNDLPPPYTETPSLTPSSLTSHLSSHLWTLPSRIRDTADRHQTAQQATDLALVTLIVPHIESFLSDLGTAPPSSRGTQQAELTLVPEKAVPSPWQLSGAAERRREGENVSLVRVEGDLDGPSEKGEKGGGDEKGGARREKDTSDGSESPKRDYTMDAWGRWDEPSSSSSSGPGSWWFTDESQARRLAGYLSPAPPVRVERTAIAQVVQTAKEEKSRWGFGRKKEAPPPTAPPPMRREEKRSVGGFDDEKVSMTVRAEEATFGKENDFGVWESMSGWALVVRVRMRI